MLRWDEAGTAAVEKREKHDLLSQMINEKRDRYGSSLGDDQLSCDVGLPSSDRWLAGPNTMNATVVRESTQTKPGGSVEWDAILEEHTPVSAAKSEVWSLGTSPLCHSKGCNSHSCKSSILDGHDAPSPTECPVKGARSTSQDTVIPRRDLAHTYKQSFGSESSHALEILKNTPRDSVPTHALEVLSKILGSEEALLELQRVVKNSSWPPRCAGNSDQIPSSPEPARRLSCSRTTQQTKEDPAKAIRFRYTENATSSKYCHICGRPAHSVKVLVCQNFAFGICRKVVCQICFGKHDWEWPSTGENTTDWLCSHCRGVCPERAQCFNYQRTNRKRKTKMISDGRQTKQREGQVGPRQGDDHPTSAPLSDSPSSPGNACIARTSHERNVSSPVSPGGHVEDFPSALFTAHNSGSSNDFISSPVSKITHTRGNSPVQAFDFHLDHGEIFPDFILEGSPSIPYPGRETQLLAPRSPASMPTTFNLNPCFSAPDLEYFP
mmetsp:Transcript_15299/g.31087  ORF Transcript_15299/g.31087 Transcript_15299/m.31087 type:complete len:494 (-) Transcript_15299:587-2068(-)|eukprot:CAMPEP_0184687232 /NCGR_PEP_ID=MMETSP0312-20130426/25660_1 /TAXON_ID=31354 /ORGANISM="Compsopogon coeruleus, Strain SAG 36.94" /LENGTH=493 /DNA_ID=CAMNT_0027143159 /DNA_START=651 /DNA_END=2132 /DNA_ORIENTATION=+